MIWISNEKYTYEAFISDSWNQLNVSKQSKILINNKLLFFKWKRSNFALKYFVFFTSNIFGFLSIHESSQIIDEFH